MIRVELKKLNYKHILVDINQINSIFNFKNRNYDTTMLKNNSLGFRD
jgi:hypothetical protein